MTGTGTGSAAILVACCAAVGLPTRTVGLMTADAATREAGAGQWLPDRQGWALADAQWNATPFVGNDPLHALELGRALSAGTDLAVDTPEPADGPAWLAWLREYLVFYRTPLALRFDGERDATPDLLLAPCELDPPALFQRRWPLGPVVVTRSADSFYALPT